MATIRTRASLNLRRRDVRDLRHGGRARRIGWPLGQVVYDDRGLVVPTLARGWFASGVEGLPSVSPDGRVGGIYRASREGLLVQWGVRVRSAEVDLAFWSVHGRAILAALAQAGVRVDRSPRRPWWHLDVDV